MKITFHGHSCFVVETGGKTIAVDPFITGNPAAKIDAASLKVDYILLTHGHGDHVGDTVELAKRNDALVIGNHEIATYFGWQGLKTHGLSIGGKFAFDFGTVKLTPAFHGSSLEFDDRKEIVYLGQPAGILLKAEGKTVYFAGDTALFYDMKLIGELESVDIAMLPIGDNYTMGPEEALLAAQWVKAKRVVPIHYNTFPLLNQDANAFVEALGRVGIEGSALQSGESIEV